MKNQYSEKEIQLFVNLGFNQDYYEHIEPSVMYRILIEQCFIENIQGEQAESLRRCVKAMWEGFPFRLTEDFDSLITI